MASRTATFAVGAYCSGGNHASVDVVVNSASIGSVTATISEAKDQFADLSNQELAESCLKLLGFMVHLADPASKAEAKTMIESASVVINWTNP